MHAAARTAALVSLATGVAAAQAPSDRQTSLLASAAAAAYGQVLGSPSVADDTFIKVRAGGQLLFQSGSIEVGDGVAGVIDDLDFNDVLDQDNFEASPFGTVAVAIPAIDLLIEGSFLGSYSFAGDTSGIEIAYNGDVYSGDIATSQSYEVYTLDAMYELLELSIVKLHLGLGVRGFAVESNIAGTVEGAAASDEETAFVPLPIVAAGARLDLGENLFVQARLGGMVYGDFGNIIDGSLEIGWDFFRNAGLFAGYRVIHASSDVFDVDFDLTLQGPYAGIELRI
ncbi:MAG: hypothetical protein AAGF47_01705 [Planctomycetota bacterium]